jgi:hypothetical protein
MRSFGSILAGMWHTQFKIARVESNLYIFFSAVSHLGPLTIASHVTQGTTTRLDHVLLTLANLYRIYSKLPEIDSEVSRGLCASIEKRWAACDQDVFILAVFFNPYIRADLFNRSNTILNPAGLVTLVLRVWARLFQQSSESVPPGLRRATVDYYSRNAEFADDEMHLKLAAAEAHEQARSLFSMPTYVLIYMVYS